MRCHVCFEVAPRKQEHLFDWLASECKVDRAFAQSYFVSSQRPVRLPTHRPIPMGKRHAHNSHFLMAYKGLVFCSECGYYAHSRMIRLMDPCDGRAAPRAERRVKSLKEGKLPHDVRDWPNADVYKQVIIS